MRSIGAAAGANRFAPLRSSLNSSNGPKAMHPTSGRRDLCLKTKSPPVSGPSSNSAILEFLERAKGLEPSTPTLARSCSTTELHPHPKDCRRTRRQRAELCQMPPANATATDGFGPAMEPRIGPKTSPNGRQTAVSVRSAAKPPGGPDGASRFEPFSGAAAEARRQFIPGQMRPAGAPSARSPPRQNDRASRRGDRRSRTD